MTDFFLRSPHGILIFGERVREAARMRDRLWLGNPATANYLGRFWLV
ncbi:MULTISPECIES: hypothetical protein [Planktothricoides]|uniref:Uncharacterized protein n=2 Tax=Planktothricoides raciborskii TaxID=132608 RepID=A0AAU8J7V8_9CYAN|nr:MULTISPECIES: hypothetical protein [Planktothricoides]MBD2542929.1 hypothetical protein [Planktothricoides raciborskii FACHB-1370]MBD2581805.1 hypothetical protein [Planktothricoides raciborskii FACHB-1261]